MKLIYVSRSFLSRICDFWLIYKDLNGLKPRLHLTDLLHCSVVCRQEFGNISKNTVFWKWTNKGFLEAKLHLQGVAKHVVWDNEKINVVSISIFQSTKLWLLYEMEPLVMVHSIAVKIKNVTLPCFKCIKCCTGHKNDKEIWPSSFNFSFLWN